MRTPRFCRNPRCRYARKPIRGWCTRAGTYSTIAHGEVQRYRCRLCGTGCSAQTESMHYYAKRRLNLRLIRSRLRGGSSMRDIGRHCGCSRMAIANAALRLGRQSMAAQASMLRGIQGSGSLCFDGLVSAVTTRDYPSQITVLADSKQELIVAMTHCVTERGGRRTPAQEKRIEKRRQEWRPKDRALTESITLLVNELPHHAGPGAFSIDTDEHPIYRAVIARDRALRWYRQAGLLRVRRTPGSAARTTDNPMFILNYIDRMIRHRMKEHTRETFALGRNSTMQMHRMWIFAWDHNASQPRRVKRSRDPSRIEYAERVVNELKALEREFYSWRISLRDVPVDESMRRVWLGQLDTPPVRWKVAQKRTGPTITEYAKRDLRFADLQAR